MALATTGLAYACPVVSSHGSEPSGGAFDYEAVSSREKPDSGALAVSQADGTATGRSHPET